MKIGDGLIGGLGDLFGNKEPEKTTANTQKGFGSADSVQRGQANTLFDQLQELAFAERIGTLSQALTGGDYPNLPNVNTSTYPVFDQGSQNACGTTSLAMLMTYLGVPETKDSIDHAIRRNDIFTAPNDLIDFARDHGLAAEGYNHGSVGEIKNMISQGYPVQCLINAEGGSDPSKMHYVDVIGFELDTTKNPPQEMVLLRDPANGDAGKPQPQKMALSDFENKWDHPGFGFDHYFNAYGPGGANLPPGRDDGIEGTLAGADGIQNLSNGFDRMVNPDSFGGFVHGAFETYGGFYQTIVGGIGSLSQMGGNWLHDAVDGIPVLQNLVQPFADGITMGGAVLGDVGDMFGETLDDVGGSFESLFDGDIGGFFDGLGHAAFDDIGGGLFNIFDDVTDGMMGGLDDLFGTDIFGDFGNALTDGVDWVGGAVSDLAGDAVGGVEDFLGDAADTAGGIISDAGDAVGGFVEDVGDFFGF